MSRQTKPLIHYLVKLDDNGKGMIANQNHT